MTHRLVERGHILVVEDGHEAVAGVDFGGQSDAAGTVVPAGTVDALVADAVDVAVALVTKSGVTDVATGGEEGQDAAHRLGALKDQGKRMARIVAMVSGTQARSTQVKILAIQTENAKFVEEA